MAAAVYSTRFYAGLAPANSNTTLYTVPSNYIAIVRCIDAVASAPGTAGSAQVLIAGKAYITTGNFTTTVQYLHWEGRQVLNAGESLSGNVTSVATYLCISGYLFQLT